MWRRSSARSVHPEAKHSPTADGYRFFKAVSFLNLTSWFTAVSPAPTSCWITKAPSRSVCPSEDPPPTRTEYSTIANQENCRTASPEDRHKHPDVQALGNVMMQVMEKRQRHDDCVGATELHRWAPTVADFLSETLSTSAEELAQVCLSHVGVRTSLTFTASLPSEWMAQGGPPLADIIRSNFITPGVRDRTVTVVVHYRKWCLATHAWPE